MFYLGRNEYPVTGFHNGLALIATKNGYKYVNTAGALVYSWSDGDEDDYEDDDDWYAPKNNEQMSFRERMQEFTNMTLNLDTRKL